MCAVATLAFNLMAIQDLVAGFASRHSPRSVANVIRRLPGGLQIPVVAYDRNWPSAFFYLKRDQVFFIAPENRASIFKLCDQSPQLMVLVESGPLLEQLLADVPARFETEVHRPEQVGHVALLVIRQPGQPPLLHQARLR